MVCQVNQKQWDFSVTSAILTTLMVLFLANIIRLSYMPYVTRNRLTLTIWWSMLLNLVALQIKNLILICLDLKD